MIFLIYVSVDLARGEGKNAPVALPSLKFLYDASVRYLEAESQLTSSGYDFCFVQ